MPLCEIHWEVTNKCNIWCKHCLPMSGHARSGELTTEEAMAALETFQAAGASNIYFTGGEPFSRKDLPNLLERAMALGMRAIVITNTILLQQTTLEMIKRLGIELGVSLDGMDEATNDAIRGHGSFRHVIEVLKQCQDISIPTTLYVTVTATNVSQLDALARLAREYECKGIHFNEVTIAGRALGFSDELALSAEQRERLPELVASVTSDIFGEQVSVMDECCWVDGTTLYMTADGNLYVCSEIFQRRPNLAIGNIRSLSFKVWLEQSVSVYTNHWNKCCYSMRASEHIIFIGNVVLECAFAPRKRNIETLSQLYDALDELYRDIEQDCINCNLCREFHDCMGYIWLLDSEVERLYEKRMSLVQVNNGPTFINPFPSASEGSTPDLTVRSPVCSQLSKDGRRCTIHNDRPLVCRFYPLGLETKADGTIVWALHQDCLHIRRLEERGLLPDFEYQVRNIINDLSSQLLEEIVETYREVDAISSFPDGENNYSTLKEVNSHV